MTSEELISRAYSAFNRRDIDAALALMTDDVSWPKASEGGRVVGKRSIREYWTRQWAEFDPHVDPLDIVENDGAFVVRVRQLVKALNGETLSDTEVRHVYTIANGRIERMDIPQSEQAGDEKSSAFRTRATNDMLPIDVFPRAIDTERLQLRSPEAQFASLYASQAQLACRQPKPLSNAEAQRFADFMIGHWQRFGFGFLVASAPDDFGARMTIGHIGFKYTDARPGHWPENFDAIELGYSLIPTARGRGLATEGANAALTAAFAAFEIPSILAKCNRENSKSAAVLLRCGMREVDSADDMRRFKIERPG